MFVGTDKNNIIIDRRIYKPWFKALPSHIRQLINRYPHGRYIVKQGAPYGLTYGGTEVTLFSHFEDGTVKVIVHAEDKKPEAILHEKMLGAKFGKSAAFIENLHGQDSNADIDPKYLTLIKPFKVEELITFVLLLQHPKTKKCYWSMIAQRNLKEALEFAESAEVVENNLLLGIMELHPKQASNLNEIVNYIYENCDHEIEERQEKENAPPAKYCLHCGKPME